MDRYREMLKQMPVGMQPQAEEKSFWDMLADQFRAKAAPMPGSGPKIDQDKAKGFVKSFRGY